VRSENSISDDEMDDVDSKIKERNSQGRSVKGRFLKSKKDEGMSDLMVEGDEIHKFNDENEVDDNRMKDDEIDKNVLDLDDRDGGVDGSVDNLSLAHNKRGSSVDSVMGRQTLPCHKRAKVRL
jgi:hypothetical protein